MAFRFFSPLGAVLKARIAEALRTDHWEEQSVIFRENSRVVGDQMRLYILEQGQCVKAEMKKDLSSIKKSKRPMLRKQTSVFMTNDSYCAPGSYFGVLECLYGSAHQYTLTTLTEATMLSISRDQLAVLFGDQKNELFDAMRHSVRIHLVTEMLSQLDAEWRYVSQSRIERILSSSQTKRFKKWETIFNQGQTMNTICMLEEGTCVEYDFDLSQLKEIEQHTFEECINREHNFPGDHLGTIGFLRAAGAGGKAVAGTSFVAVTECLILQIAISTIFAEEEGMKNDPAWFRNNS